MAVQDTSKRENQLSYISSCINFKRMNVAALLKRVSSSLTKPIIHKKYSIQELRLSWIIELCLGKYMARLVCPLPFRKGLPVLLSIDSYFKYELVMGQSHLNKEQPASLQVVYRNVDSLFGQLSKASKPEQVNEPIVIISRNLIEQGSFEKKQAGFYVNPVLLKCVFHPDFDRTVKNMLGILIKELKSILESKMLILVSRERFRKALNIANFCIFLTNQNLIQTINLLSVRSDLDAQTKELVNEYAKDGREINHQIIESIPKDHLIEMARLLRISMDMMIDLHLKLITRSDYTLGMIDCLSQSIFVLYSKIFFSEVKDISKRESQQNNKKLIKIGSYFLGFGMETKTAPVYEFGVLLLCHLFQNNRTDIKEQKPLPSHLFKSLPIVAHNNMIHWITNTLLFSLKYIKQGDNVFSKLNTNRIFPFKLLSLIFEHFKPQDHQISYLLEEICLQTKNFQIERVYVSSLAKMYSEGTNATELIKKYAQMGEINYNIKGSKKAVKIRPEDVRTELEDNEESIRKQVLEVCNKYIVMVIFHKPNAMFEYSDKALWNMILYQLEEDGDELEEKQEELNKEGEVEQA